VDVRLAGSMSSEELSYKEGLEGSGGWRFLGFGGVLHVRLGNLNSKSSCSVSRSGQMYLMSHIVTQIEWDETHLVS
jgi:hypothetical protein